jgi:hypothetical protein
LFHCHHVANVGNPAQMGISPSSTVVLTCFTKCHGAGSSQRLFLDFRSVIILSCKWQNAESEPIYLPFYQSYSHKLMVEER